MKRVLSIQMQSMGHATYGALFRKMATAADDLRIDSFWAQEQRSLWTKVVRRLAEMKIPRLNRSNLDLRRARAEWSTGRMCRNLARKKLKLNHYDVLHFHTQTAAYGSVSLMKAIPTFVTIDMTAFQLKHENKLAPAWTYYPNIVMERNVLAAAHHIIAFSEWARQSVISEHKIPADRVSTITPGVNIARFPPPAYNRQGKLKILFVGNDFVRKGGDDLLAVFLEAFTESAELHLVTNTPVEVLNPSVHVHRGVAVYSEQWLELYHACEIFVMVSHAEALGMVFQEAAASGLALIGTNVGGIPGMITHGGNGFLIEPGDRKALATYLKKLLDDPGLREKMRKKSRDRAIQDFDADINFAKIMDLFKSAAKSP
jgi:starch synthase